MRLILLLAPFLMAAQAEIEIRGVFVEAIRSEPSPTIPIRTYCQSDGKRVVCV